MKLKGKNICVTGGLGFIGSHFIELLLERCSGCSIDILDTVSYCVSEKTEDFLQSIKSDNCLRINYIDIGLYLIDNHYDYIINFAAESHVDNSISDPDSFVDSNYTGFFNIVNQIDKSTRFLQISTDEVYGSCLEATEQSPLNPSSVYSSTKAGADLLGLSMHKTNGLDFLVTRSCNNFGPRQFDEKFIPVILKNIFSKNKIPVYGDGQNKRQWIDVRENCEQILGVMLHGASGEVYNITPYQEENIISNLNLISLIASACEYEGEDLKEFVKDRQGHDFSYGMIGEKTKKLLRDNKFDVTFFSLEEKLKQTADWYKNNLDWFSR